MEKDTRWQWDNRLHRYRDTQTGRFLSETKAERLRNMFTDKRDASMDTLTRTIFGGAEPGSDEWLRRIDRFSTEGWAHAQSTFVAQYMAGHGGWKTFDDGARREIGRLLDEQQTYWNRFMDQARQGKLKSVNGIANRANLYTSESTMFYERGRAGTWAISLPGYPGDGFTVCMANCRCSWRITERKGVVYATWKTSPGEVCPDCIDRSTRWAPFTITRTT